MIIYINVGVSNFSIESEAIVWNIEQLEEISVFEEQIKDNNSKTFVLVHDFVSTDILAVFCYLKEICGVQVLVDWYQSNDYEEYKGVIQNCLGLGQLQEKYYSVEIQGYKLEINYNPVNLIVMGQTDSIQSQIADCVLENKMRVVRLKKQIFEIDKIVKAHIAESFSELTDNCSNKDVVKIIEFYKLDVDSIKKSVISELELKSFYDGDYTWEELFSKNRKTDLDVILKRWNREFIQELSDVEIKIVKKLCDNIQQVVNTYYEDSKRGPYFVRYLLEEQFMLYLQTAMEQIRQKVERIENEKYALKAENSRSFEEAQNVKWNFARREETLDEYVSNMENYYVHLCKLEECKTFGLILQKLYDVCEAEKNKLRDVIQKIENYMSCYQSDIIKEFAEVNLDSDFFDEIMNREFEFEANCKNVEERLLAEYADKIIECICKRMSNAQGKKVGNRLVFDLEELHDVPFEKFTDDVENCIQNKKQVNEKKWNRIYEYMKYGVFCINENKSCVLNVREEIPVFDTESMSIKELLDAHAYCQKIKGDVVKRETFILENEISKVDMFFEQNSLLIEKCELEMTKLRRLEEMDKKILNRLL